MKKQTIWIFFDVGSTLIDESRAYERRIREMTAGTDITPEMFQQKRIDFAKQNENSFPAAAQFFGLQKHPGRKEKSSLIRTRKRFSVIYGRRATGSALLPTNHPELQTV